MDELAARIGQLQVGIGDTRVVRFEDVFVLKRLIERLLLTEDRAAAVISISQLSRSLRPESWIDDRGTLDTEEAEIVRILWFDRRPFVGMQSLHFEDGHRAIRMRIVGLVQSASLEPFSFEEAQSVWDRLSCTHVKPAMTVLPLFHEHSASRVLGLLHYGIPIRYHEDVREPLCSYVWHRDDGIPAPACWDGSGMDDPCLSQRELGAGDFGPGDLVLQEVYISRPIEYAGRGNGISGLPILELRTVWMLARSGTVSRLMST
ncbi:hypothetical protein BV25DRAFT_1835448 [Artomyces pyxidatus]|uniref:Uncharacterized protein n=1 Tax=Artomyces pyxidatus TaxID=48021 RepID=A0ACB8TFB3_9AGAM|nr:hypothetical protein BV25DRAFT_1835448 [Artomyces pyxidatus]